MTKTGRDRRIQIRAQRRAEKLSKHGVLTFANGSTIVIERPMLSEIEALGMAALTDSEEAFNQKMSDMGVPSFASWAEKNLQRVIDNAAMAGKPGAFILQQMIGVQDDPVKENE